jgi:hypothetical protein
MKDIIQLPILNDDNEYCYIIILLGNDNVIIGRHGNTEFGYQVSKCYYYKDIKQVPFYNLDEPFKSLIIEKLFEEESEGCNMENLIHLMPKPKTRETSSVLLCAQCQNLIKREN